MDPISQGVLGAAFASSFAKKQEIRIAALAGALSGMAADLDVLIRSKQNPLLFIEYHRHFSHSLAFVPVGALLCTALFWIFFRKKMNFARLYFFSFLGYLTHGLLDACTSFGTLLFWPFSHQRIAWSNISIIDLLYTLPLLIFVSMACITKKRIFARTGLILSCLYLLFGFYQNHQARDYALQIARQRGHTVQRIEVQPTFLNLFVWRSIYESEGKYYVDALRVGPWMPDKIYEGSSVEKYDWQSEIQKLPENSILAKDIKIFAWFSGDFLYRSPEDDKVIADLRYSPLPQQIIPLWGIVFDPDKADQHVEFKNFRKLRERSFETFMQMLKGQNL